jgi:hypothetical protein
MPTNPFFNNYVNVAEQSLIEDLIVESNKIHGQDVYYLPRTGINKDDVRNEYEYSEFNSAYVIEAYMKNFDAFEGDGQLMSKFGLEIRDQMTLVISIRSFKQYVGEPANLKRPNEGDIIYIPMLKAAYQIVHLDPSAIFYQLGTLQTYQVTLELLEHSGEVFNTGIPEIDNKYVVKDADDDAGADNNDFDGEDGFLDFSESNPFSEGY